MAEQNVTGNGRKLVEYRSVITLGNLLSIVTIVVTVSAGAIWWNGDVQARLATLETKMEFTEAALAAMAQKWASSSRNSTPSAGPCAPRAENPITKDGRKPAIARRARSRGFSSLARRPLDLSHKLGTRRSS